MQGPQFITVQRSIPSPAEDAGSQLGARMAACCRLRGAFTALSLFCSVSTAFAEKMELAEPVSDDRVFQVESSITSSGKVLTAQTGGEKDELPMQADVSFQFLSRRLPPAGRDALALRELRDFSTAQLKTTVSDYETSFALPERRSLVVANGTREGILSYSPQGPLTRETADLLEIPGDPLALRAMLPLTGVEPGEEWSPPDWALQLLTGIEAVESQELKCRLDKATPTAAKITFRGAIKGQKHGANTTVDVVGAMIFDREQSFLSQAKTVYTISSDIGTVNPGLEMQVTATVSRTPSTATGQLTKERLSGIPLEAPEDQLRLIFDASPWGMTISHSRDWHLFRAIFDGGAPVAIFRLIELGSLVAQCNMSPLPRVSGNQKIGMQEFEADIQKSLGERFGEIISRDIVPLEDGREMIRIAVSGNVILTSKDGRADMPMTWIYYLVKDNRGHRASFVFQIEPALLEQLGTRDREIVSSLLFQPESR